MARGVSPQPRPPTDAHERQSPVVDRCSCRRVARPAVRRRGLPGAKAARSRARSSSSTPPKDATAARPPTAGSRRRSRTRASGPIPLAFHVDYWDRLGWKDRFASAAYTERQHAAAEANHASFVYTPQVLLPGRDSAGAPRERLWQKRRRSPPRRRWTSTSSAARGGRTRARARARDGRRASFRCGDRIAYVDSDLDSDVKAGENGAYACIMTTSCVRSRPGRSRRRAGWYAADATFAVPAEADAIPPSSRSSSVSATARCCRPSRCRWPTAGRASGRPTVRNTRARA